MFGRKERRSFSVVGKLVVGKLVSWLVGKKHTAFTLFLPSNLNIMPPTRDRTSGQVLFQKATVSEAMRRMPVCSRHSKKK